MILAAWTGADAAIAVLGAVVSTGLGLVVKLLWAQVQEERRHRVVLEDKAERNFRYIVSLRDHVIVLHGGIGTLTQQILSHGDEPVWVPPEIPPLPND